MPEVRCSSTVGHRVRVVPVVVVARPRPRRPPLRQRRLQTVARLRLPRRMPLLQRLRNALLLREQLLRKKLPSVNEGGRKRLPARVPRLLPLLPLR
jgi:hypothetical protein